VIGEQSFSLHGAADASGKPSSVFTLHVGGRRRGGKLSGVDVTPAGNAVDVIGSGVLPFLAIRVELTALSLGKPLLSLH
jgi:hypothetical protein